MKLHKVCAVAASASLLGFPAAIALPELSALPHASAQESSSKYRTVTAGSMSWGVRESFRKYVETGVAKGTISTGGGATRSGGSFSFPADASAITSQSAGQINFQGEVHFTGHHGALDMTLRNPVVVVNGTQGELRVDYASRKYEGMNKTGEMREGRSEVLATLALNKAPDFNAAQTTIAGSATLTATGADIFGGFYEEGESLDPISIGLSLDDASGPAPTPDFSVGSGGADGTGATRSSATSGPASLLGGINDTLVEVNGLFVNTDHVLQSGESLYNRVQPGRNSAGANPAGGTGGSASASQGSGAGGAAGGASGSGGGAAGAGGSNGTGGSGAASAGGTAGAGASDASGAGGAGGAGGGSANGVCEGSSSRGVVSADAQWGIRQSFRTYIRGNIAKGAWELKGVGDNGSAFTYTGDSGAVDTAERSGTILYPGSIRFTGHDGILDTRFSNMEIQFHGNSGQIVLNATSNSTDGQPNDYGRVAIANLSLTSLDISDSAVSGTAEATLTDVGAEAFGQFYPAGDPLDPISFSAQLGGSANCREGQGGGSSAASTGKGNSAANAAQLRGGGATAQAKLQSGGKAAGAGSSVFDDLDAASTVASAQQPEGGKFQIKNLAAGDDSGGWDDSAVAKLLLLAGSLLGAGGALTRFVVAG